VNPVDDTAMPTDHAPDDAAEGPSGSSDADIAALRTRLESIDDVAVAERVAVFETANATLTAALAELDEV
jgi:hypothetical protein